MEAETLARQDHYLAIRHRIRMGAIWCWAACVVLFVIAFLIAGFIPPPKENWSAERVAEFYAANRDAIRIGLIGSMFASALMLPFYAAISQEIRRIEGPGSLLAPIQWGGAVILVCFFQIIGLMWLLASFRPEADPELVRAFNDYGWLVWTILIPTYSLQYVCIALAGFIDERPRPAWPRWAAYANLWVAFTGAGGICAVFFKTGPFSWNGLVGYWIPVVVFVLGMTMNMFLLRQRALDDFQAEETPCIR